MRIKFLFPLLMFGLVLFGQAKLEHEKKFYKDADGKLYVNKDIPLYLYLSDNKEGSGNHYLLESQSSPEYSTPFFLDTEGWNTIRTPSKVDPVTRKVILPISDVIFELYADGIAPTTKIQYKNVSLYRSEGNLYMGKGLKINLISQDKVSGVEQILYSVDGAAYTKYTSELTFDKEKDYVLRVYAVDNVGNVENEKQLKFIPDYSAPVTEITLNKDFKDNIISPRTTFTLSSKDNLSGVKYTLFNYNDGKNNYYNNLISPGWIEEGEHTLVYYSGDFVDNVEKKKKFQFYMDKSPPEVTFELVGDDYSSGQTRFISARTRMRLKATDNKAGVKEVYYSINGKKSTLYTEPFLIDVKATSVYIRYYAIDNVENSSKNKAESGSSSLNFKFIRDEDPPKISFNYSQPNIIVNKMLYLRETSKITINASDVLSGVKEISYKIDDKENIFEKPFIVSEEGKHKVVYKAIDNSNNETSETIDFYIDNTGPEINIQFGIGELGEDTINGSKVNVYPPKTAVFITATDQLVGYDKIFYSINGNAEIESKGVLKNLPDGEYKLTVRALDKLGNSASKSIAFIIRKDL
jgi:predicted small secreted protein